MFPLSFLIPESLQLSNQSCAQPTHFPYFPILMNYHNYLSKYWSYVQSVSTSLFVISPHAELFGQLQALGLLYKGFMRTNYVGKLRPLPGCNAKGQARASGTHTAALHGTSELQSKCRQNEAQHQIKSSVQKNVLRW